MSREHNIAFCGLNCFTCPAYIAKFENNEELREKTANEWSSYYSGETKILPSEIDCDGCHETNGKLFTHCMDCEVRKCALSKSMEISICADCNDYPCNKLQAYWNLVQNENIIKLLNKLHDQKFHENKKSLIFQSDKN